MSGARPFIGHLGSLGVGRGGMIRGLIVLGTFFLLVFVLF